MIPKNLTKIIFPIIALSSMSSLVLASSGAKQKPAMIPSSNNVTDLQTQVLLPLHDEWQEELKALELARRKRRSAGAKQKGYRYKPAEHVMGAQFFKEKSDVVYIPKSIYDHISDTSQEIATQLDKNSSILDENTSLLKENSDTLEKNGSELTKISATLRELGEGTAKLKAEIEEMNAELKKKASKDYLSYMSSDDDIDDQLTTEELPEVDKEKAALLSKTHMQSKKLKPIKKGGGYLKSGNMVINVAACIAIGYFVQKYACPRLGISLQQHSAPSLANFSTGSMANPDIVPKSSYLGFKHKF